MASTSASWLATIGGLLGVVGWLPFSALAALDDLASAMAQVPGGRYSALGGVRDGRQ
ncbi:hypothetical protein ACX801_18840 [Arthrobacter bambusae]|uniref:hypothetical protein n=1 Tax=Arthrobacter sp. efr-133-R2A-120 TaxID=3040277 RepID=UPI00254EBF59|nr:hypothetical protein [Arthrobacter sp. efr-133-R2A-120]